MCQECKKLQRDIRRLKKKNRRLQLAVDEARERMSGIMGQVEGSMGDLRHFSAWLEWASKAAEER
jgi:hypothetical protein